MDNEAGDIEEQVNRQKAQFLSWFYQDNSESNWSFQGQNDNRLLQAVKNINANPKHRHQ